MSAAAELTETVADEVARRIANPWALPVPPPVLGAVTVRAVGVDVVDVPRLDGMVRRRGDRLVARLLTPAELRLCADASHRHRVGFLAGRLAAKEAIGKTFGGRGAGVGWHDVEIGRGAAGEPLPRLTGRAAEAFRLSGLTRLNISITHEAGVAVAVALAG
ncbi:holo-ACP synthase [Streptomyces sp. NPDC060194]|uniref:holo-ACP synthase n=1 Tax=Streptomyces sp. NPDC060194 TaxID=3347069 RepID=UPI003647352B